MRRGIRSLLAVTALGCLCPVGFAQYPYPAPGYGPMPMQPMPMPAYGYPGTMMPPPGYPQNPYAPNPYASNPYGMAMQRPAYPYAPPMPQAPTYPYPSANAPRVVNYGPLLDISTPPTVPQRANATPMVPQARQMVPAFAATESPVAASLPPAPPSSVVRTSAAHAEPAPEACSSPGCGSAGSCGASGSCAGGCPDGDTCRRPIYAMPPAPRGHYIGDVGVNFVVPYPDTRNAYVTTNRTGQSTTTVFSHDMEVAPYFQFGYVCHNGWGLRSDFWFLHGNTTVTAANSDPLAQVVTPLAQPFQIVSPGAALLTGVGSDQLTVTRSFDFKVVDIDVVKECNIFDMCFIFGGGARYAQITQSYSASRSNPGGPNPVTGASASLDREQLDLVSRFRAVGPTWSLEMVHPIKGSCFSFYANLRGSVLFGTEDFNENHQLQSAITPAGGPTAFTNTNNSLDSTGSRVIPVVDTELGIQLGKRCGPCYLYGRLGFAYSRWWDVGSPLGFNGNLDLIGGTVKVGIIY